jgi:hypothetical protein
VLHAARNEGPALGAVRVETVPLRKSNASIDVVHGPRRLARLSPKTMRLAMAAAVAVMMMRMMAPAWQVG